MGQSYCHLFKEILDVVGSPGTLGRTFLMRLDPSSSTLSSVR